jgi:hypothetical protein
MGATSVEAAELDQVQRAEDDEEDGDDTDRGHENSPARS